jgi:aminocarboxymuconate-semialdehyde decarboxylase
MDAASVDVQLVSPSPNQFNYWADAALAQKIWTAVNEGIADLCAAAGGRRHWALCPFNIPTSR